MSGSNFEFLFIFFYMNKSRTVVRIEIYVTSLTYEKLTAAAAAGNNEWTNQITEIINYFIKNKQQAEYWRETEIYLTEFVNSLHVSVPSRISAWIT